MRIEPCRAQNPFVLPVVVSRCILPPALQLLRAVTTHISTPSLPKAAFGSAAKNEIPRLMISSGASSDIVPFRAHSS